MVTLSLDGAALGLAEAAAAAEGAADEGAAAEGAADAGALAAGEEHPAMSAPTTSVVNAALASLTNGTCRLSRSRVRWDPRAGRSGRPQTQLLDRSTS